MIQRMQFSFIIKFFCVFFIRFSRSQQNENFYDSTNVKENSDDIHTNVLCECDREFVLFVVERKKNVRIPREIDVMK